MSDAFDHTTVLRSTLLSERGVAHGFSTRLGGVSRGVYSSLNLGRAIGDDDAAVEANHQRLAGTVGYGYPAALFECSQVHGRAVFRVEAFSDSAGSQKAQTDVSRVGSQAARSREP